MAKFTCDLALTGGTVFTGNPILPRAQAVAVKGNKIIAVGSDEGIRALIGRNTRVIALGGRFAGPGFNDAHTHLLGGGFALTRLDLTGAASLDVLRERVALAAAKLGPGSWLEGRGWDQTLLPGGDWPPLGLLDEAAGGRPAFLWRADGHTAWASSAALATAGIRAGTADPAGGEIVRDGSGAPTGILKESATTLVERVIPKPGPAEHAAAVGAALGELRRHGITSVSDFSPPEAVRVYRQLRQERRLTARINEWAPLADSLDEGEQLREHLGPDDHYLRCTTLKAFLDGTLGSRTAAMREPYDDAPGESGLVQIGEDHLRRLVHRAHHAGFQVALHAIGDRACAMALDAIAQLGPEGAARRHRIEHAEVVDPADVARFRAAGAVASMQPGQLLSDFRWLMGRLGERRARAAFPWRGLLDAGARVILGSDWPIEPLDPLRGLYAATADLRAEESAASAPGLRAGRAMRPEEALGAATLGPAWATFEDSLKGSVQTGRLADLVVLSADPTRIGPDALPAVTVDYTIFDGKVVHAREESEPPPGA
jgi:predicted amidohydrolase YtcJ